MYKLNSGDADNNRQLYAVEVVPELRTIIRKTYTAYNICKVLFEENFDESMADDVITALTLGDELTVPLDLKEAQLLFFVLQVNLANKDSRIRSISKASIFYNEFDGDYTKVTFIDTQSTVIHQAKLFYTFVVPGVKIEIKIPFVVVNGNKGYKFAIADNTYYSLLINDQIVRTTRKAFIQLMDNCHGKMFRNHDEVMNCLNKSRETLELCLTEANMECKSFDFPFDNSLCLEFDADGKLIAWDEIQGESDVWDNRGNCKYVFNRNYDNMVPFMPTGSDILIYV